MREIISIGEAPSSPLFSQAVKAGPHIYVSGLVGIDMSTGNLAGPTIQDQTRQALTNVWRCYRRPVRRWTTSLRSVCS